MEKDHISQTQWMALVGGGLLAPAAELLPRILLPTAGVWSWLTPFLVLPVVWGMGWAVEYIRSRTQRCTSNSGAGLGWMGRALLLIYLLWGVGLFGLRLRLCAQRMLSVGERDGSLWFFFVVIGLVVLWMGRGRLAPLARSGQIFLGILLTTGAAVCLLSLGEMEWERLCPLWWKEAHWGLKGGGGLLGMFSYGIFSGFLLPKTQFSSHKRRDWITWTTVGCAILALEQLVVMGTLGISLAQRVDSPFFALAKSVGVEGAFQRVESLIAALWVLADLLLLGMLILSLRQLCSWIVPKLQGYLPETATGLTILGMALGSIIPQGNAAESLEQGLILKGNLVFGIVLPLLIAVGYGIKEEVERRRDRRDGSGERRKS